MLRVSGAWCGQHHHIAVGERVIEVVSADHGIHIRGTLAVEMATHARDVHAKGVRTLGDLEPDRAQPDDRHAPSVQHPRPVHRQFVLNPLLLLLRTQCTVEAPRQLQHATYYMLGNRDSLHAARIRELHPRRGELGEREQSLYRRRRRMYPAQSWRGGDHGRREHRGEADVHVDDRAAGLLEGASAHELHLGEGHGQRAGLCVGNGPRLYRPLDEDQDFHVNQPTRCGGCRRC